MYDKEKTEIALRVMFNWKVDYMVRKYLLCIKLFGWYKPVEMHWKNTTLTHSNVVSLSIIIRK